MFSKCQNPHLTSNILRQTPISPVMCQLILSETLFNSFHAAALPPGSSQRPSLLVMFLPVSQDPGQISEATAPFPTQLGESLPHLGFQSPVRDGAYLMVCIFHFLCTFCEGVRTCFIVLSRLQISPGIREMFGPPHSRSTQAFLPGSPLNWIDSSPGPLRG